MAAGSSQVLDLTEVTEKDGECAVCLQPYVYPAQLPCGHIFCFLCIKGTANQSKRCAMCRQEIPRDFVDRPNLLTEKALDLVDNFEGRYQWFYEGRNGWWQYDERTSKELEVAYKAGERTCELLIAGFLYVMDFDAMLQLRRTDPSRRRRMKRDLVTIDKKGIAGLRTKNSEQTPTEPAEPTNQQSTLPESKDESSHPEPTLPPPTSIIPVESSSDSSDLDDDDEEGETVLRCRVRNMTIQDPTDR